MKKIVAAWIEQILEFDSGAEYQEYLAKLKCGRPQKFKVVQCNYMESGAVKIRIRKQYNNNTFPDDCKEGGEYNND